MRVMLILIGIDSKISVSSTGQSLTIVVSLPSSLLNLETLGLLVEGCQLYQGTVVGGKYGLVDGTHPTHIKLITPAKFCVFMYYH